jgi:predicted nucleic acid-binding protein
MKYVDSNIFIYPVVADEKAESKASSAKGILLKIARGDLEAATSTLTWDELVWSTRKFLGSEVAVYEGEKFLRFPQLKDP